MPQYRRRTVVTLAVSLRTSPALRIRIQITASSLLPPLTQQRPFYPWRQSRVAFPLSTPVSCLISAAPVPVTQLPVEAAAFCATLLRSRPGGHAMKGSIRHRGFPRV